MTSKKEHVQVAVSNSALEKSAIWSGKSRTKERGYAKPIPQKFGGGLLFLTENNAYLQNKRLLVDRS